MLFFLRLEHGKHSIGHEVATDHIHSGKDDGERAQGCRNEAAFGPGRDERADDGDAGDGVRSRHERRVKLRWDFRDQLEEKIACQS